MIKKIIMIFMFLMSLQIVYSQAEKTDLLGVSVLKNEDGSVEIERTFFSYGYPTESVENGRYILQALDINGELIKEIYFDLDIVFGLADKSWFDEDGNQIIIPEFNPEKILNIIYLTYDDRIDSYLIKDNEDNLIIEKNLGDEVGIKVDSKNKS